MENSVNSDEETFEIFNERNEKIGTAPRREVHEKGHYHRGIDLFLVNSQGKIFITKRAETKDTSPGQWGMSVGEHVKPGESFMDAAIRGLKEELGITNAKIIQIKGPRLFTITYEDGKKDNEFDALFLAESDEKINIDKEEVSEGEFLTLEEIEKEIERGRIFTPFFQIEWEEFKEERK